MLAVLLTFHWSAQVCIRALPAVSLEYFGSTAEGNTAGPAGAAGAAAVSPPFFDFGLAAASVGDAGWIRWSVDLAGPAFAETRVETTCEKEGACTDRTVSVLAGRVVLQHDGQPFLSRPLTVTETDFDLPFLFDWNIANLDTSVSIDLYTTNHV